LIPIKGYSTFDPLKHCWVGSGFKAEWFDDLFPKNNKISDPLKRIADETEEDFLKLVDILESCGVTTHRSFLNLEGNGKYKSLQDIWRPPMTPRDHFCVVGEKLYIGDHLEELRRNGHMDVVNQIDKKDIYQSKATMDTPWAGVTPFITSAQICRVGKDLFWDSHEQWQENAPPDVESELIEKWNKEGFRVHRSDRGYHSDGAFCVVKPGCIVSLNDVQDYSKEFPGWDVLYLPDQSWPKLDPFLQMKEKVGGRWWLKGEEHNDQLIQFVNTWLTNWVGYVEETVFDVNMLSIDQNTIICNNYNKKVFDHFKKHGVEPIIFNFRHRYFWDGGIHCITQDLYREGKLEDYIG